MSEPIFGKEFYEKWFVPKPMSEAQAAAAQRKREKPKAWETDVLLTQNSAWIVFNEFYPDSFNHIKPSSLTDRQILLAQRMLVELLDGRRAFKTVSAFAQSVLYKSPRSLTGLGLVAINFARKLPSDAFKSGYPSDTAIAAVQEDTDLKAYIARVRQGDVAAEFDGLAATPVRGGYFF